MKNTLFLLSCITLLVTACNQEDEKACTEAPLRGLAINNATKFNEYAAAVTDGNLTNYTGYSVNTVRGITTFSIYTNLKYICKNDPPLISANLNLFTADTTVKDSLSIRETGLTYYKFEVPASGGVYSLDHFYIFDNSNGSGELNLIHYCSFPAKGSWSADSAYFFGNISTFSVSIAAQDAP